MKLKELLHKLQPWQEVRAGIGGDIYEGEAFQLASTLAKQILDMDIGNIWITQRKVDEAFTPKAILEIKLER